MSDAVKYQKTLYTLPDQDLVNEKIVETNDPLAKLTNQLNTKSKNRDLNAAKLAQSYLAQRLVHVRKYFISEKNAFLIDNFQDKILDIHIPSHGKSYLINDIDWFCQIINQLFNAKTRPHRKMEFIIEQLKHTIGQNARLIMKNDMKKAQIDGNEVFSSLFR